jgi:NAD(P)-dependent dehydrogenase (short-subunit alcohol dehydrogenase family)
MRDKKVWLITGAGRGMGADAVAAVEQKAQTLLAQAGAYRGLSGSLAYDDA